jgi:hypothetical protein
MGGPASRICVPPGERRSSGNAVLLRPAGAGCRSGVQPSVSSVEPPGARKGRGPGVSRRAIAARPAPASVTRQQRRADCSYPCNPALRRSCRAPAARYCFPPEKRTSPSSGVGARMGRTAGTEGLPAGRSVSERCNGAPEAVEDCRVSMAAALFWADTALRRRLGATTRTRAVEVGNATPRPVCCFLCRWSTVGLLGRLG